MCYVAITLNACYYCVVCVDFSTLEAAGVVDCVDLSGGGFLRQVRNRTIIYNFYIYIFLPPKFYIWGRKCKNKMMITFKAIDCGQGIGGVI